MKEKLIVGIIFILVLIGVFFSTIIISKKENFQEKIAREQNPLTDECTEEYEIMQKEEIIEEVSFSEDRISSNSMLILKKYYKECGHTINEYTEMLPELVNMTEDEIDDEFNGWDLIGFSGKEVTFLKEFEGTCGEHFKLKEEDGIVVIYRILEDGSEQIYDQTEISTEFLTEIDLSEIRTEEGIQVYGKEELNKVLEDFE